MTPEEVANKLREMVRQARVTRPVRDELLSLANHLSPRPRHRFERTIYMVRSWRDDGKKVMEFMQKASPSTDLVGAWWGVVAAQVSGVPDDVNGVWDVCVELLDSEVPMTTRPAQRTSTAQFRVLLTFEYDDTWLFTDDADAIQRVIYNLGGVRGAFDLCPGRS